MDDPSGSEPDIYARDLKKEITKDVLADSDIKTALNLAFGWTMKTIVKCHCKALGRSFYSVLILQDKEHSDPTPLMADTLDRLARNSAANDLAGTSDCNPAHPKNALAIMHKKVNDILRQHEKVNASEVPVVSLATYVDPEAGSSGGVRFFGMLGLRKNTEPDLELCKRLYLINKNREHTVFYGSFVLPSNDLDGLKPVEPRIIGEPAGLRSALDDIAVKIDKNQQLVGFAKAVHLWSMIVAGLASVAGVVMAGNSLIYRDSLTILGAITLIVFAVLMMAVAFGAKDFLRREKVWKQAAQKTIAKYQLLLYPHAEGNLVPR